MILTITEIIVRAVGFQPVVERLSPRPGESTDKRCHVSGPYQALFFTRIGRFLFLGKEREELSVPFFL